MSRITALILIAVSVVFFSHGAFAKNPRRNPTPTPTPTASITVLPTSPSSVSASPGSSFQLTYNFSGGPTSSAMTVFVHFTDAAGAIVFGADHTPPTATTAWSGAISYTRSVYVPATVVSGMYKILVGLYDPTTGKRIALVPGSGVTDAGSSRYQIGSASVQSMTATPSPTPVPTPAPTPAPSPTPAPTSGIPAGYTTVLASSYGVKCDGVTDNAAAIQSAVNALTSYKALVFPSGTCVMSNWITMQGKSNVAVVGAGKDLTILKATDPNHSTFDVYGSSNVLIQDFQVYSPNTVTRLSDGLSRGFYADNSSFVTFRRLKANNVSGAGLLFHRVTDSVIEDSEVYNSWADAFHVTGGSQRITVRNNLATGPGDDCFASIGYDGGQNQDVSFFDNVCRDGHWGGGVSFEGNLRGKAYRNKIYRVGISCFRVTSWNVYPTTPNDQIDFRDNYGEGCVTRTNTGHGAVMIFTNYSNISNVVFERTTIVNPATGIGVRAFGQNGATVQAAVNNSTIQGATTCYKIEAGATVTRVGGTCN